MFVFYFSFRISELFFHRLLLRPGMGDTLLRTSLYQSHISAGAKMVDFHGYELPIWYSSIQEEHISTRTKAGMFDVSHMGFFRFRGDQAKSWLSSVCTQDISKFVSGRCGYAHFLDHSGHIIDDMIFAISSNTEILGVPNSTMVSRMFEWLSSLNSNGKRFCYARVLSWLSYQRNSGSVS